MHIQYDQEYITRMSHLRPLKHPFYKRKIKMIPGHARDRFAKKRVQLRNVQIFFYRRPHPDRMPGSEVYKVRKWRNFGARKNRLTKFSQFTVTVISESP